MTKVEKFLRVFEVCFQLGKELSDKIGLFLLYLKYPLANRNLSKYSGCEKTFRVRLSNRTYTITLRDNGMDMQIFLSIFAFGEYDISHSISDPATVYDLGANIGLAAIWFSSKFPNATFWGFEPVPENYYVAIKNHSNLSGKSFPTRHRETKRKRKDAY